MIPPDKREEWIIREARERSAAERAAFLDGACAGDVTLRERLDALFATHEQPDSLLATVKETARPTVTLDLPEAQEAPAQVIGHYKLLEKIGEGGMGEVWMADQREPVKRRVALKIIKLGMDSRQIVARFEAERQALALMDHANIAKVFDAGATEAGRPYFVMELVRGIKITDYCDQNQLPTAERLKLFILVCKAIQHAHQKGIIHRDIKPSNILVTLHDGVPAPKVIDFGIAKATQQELTEKTLFTQFQQFIGTPAYISPEQAELSGLDIDTRADIYSLGVLLYELLVGQTPFDANEMMKGGLDALRQIIREKEPLQPSTRLNTLPGDARTTAGKRRQTDVGKLVHQLQGDLDWIVMKCLEKDRTRRYDTANGLAMDIQRHLSCEPVLARPPSKLYELQKTVRRHKFGFAAAAAIFFVLAVGITLTAWQAVRATRASKAENRHRLAADAAREQALAAQKLAETARTNEVEMRRLAEARAYAGDMNLAQQALAENNLGLATELLDRHRPQPGQPDRRGWEWRYLWQQSRSDALYTLCQQSNRITDLAISHDGKWLAIEADGVSVWNLVSRREVMRVRDKGTPAFSPVRPLLAMWNSVDSGSSESKYRLCFWDATTERFLPEPPSPDSSASGLLRGMAFTSDGQTLVSASVAWLPDPNQLTCWRISDGKKLATYPIQIRGSGVGMPVSMPRGANLIALAEDDRWIRVIDANSGIEKFKTQAPGKGWLESVALSADGRMLAGCSGTDETTIRLWDVAGGKEVGILEGHRAYVIALAFWPDGKTLASASADQTIRIWNVEEKHSIAVLRGHRAEVQRLALLPDNSTLISGAKDGTVMVWDTAAIRHKQTIVTLPSTVFGFWALARGGDSILTVEGQGWLTRWHGQDFQQSERLFQIDPAPEDACLSADQRLLATGSTNGSVKLWDVPQRKLLRETRLSAARVLPRTFLAHNNRLAVWLEGEKALAILDVATGGQISAVKGSWGAISPDGHWWLTEASKGLAVLRELPSGRELNSVRVSEHSNAAFSPDRRLLAIPFDAGVVRLWDVPTLKERTMFTGFLLGAHSATFSPDGRRLAVGSAGNESLKMWDLESGLNVLTLPGEGGPCWKTQFSPAGNILAAWHELGMLDIWRAPSWEEIAAAELKENAKIKQP